jgi:hypothetical protein
MSWLGKILSFLVLIGAVVWAALTANAYATRTNWKVRADAFEKAYKESEESRKKEARDYEASREAAVRIASAAQSRADDLTKQLEDVSAAGRKVDAEYKKLEQDYRDADVQAKILQASVKTIQEELKQTRDRSNLLEDERVRLVLAKEAAERDRVKADNEARLARALSEENAKKVENLTAMVTELRQTGGGTGTASVLRHIDKIPAPLPENIRGHVVRDMQGGNFVQINLGIDAGLEPGSKLDVYREGGGGKYLGTLTVTKSIYPKEAVAEFKPARPVPVAQLRPEELPRKGDTVGVLSQGGPR